ncbi:MAG: dockerin type I domain-containing protein, partial [Chloroflexota bacterium]
VYFRGFNPGVDSSWNRMFAYATDPSGTVWTTFPTANPLDRPFSYFYEWPKTNDPFYLRTLPQAARQPSLSLAFTSTPAPQEAVTASDTITYRAAVTNLESEAESGIQLIVSGTTGLSYQSVTGASSSNCPTPISCTITLPTIPGGGTQIVTLTANTVANLTGIEQVGTTPQLRSQLPLPLANFGITHTVDITAPIVTIDTNPGNVLGSGTQTVSGSASDRLGAGVASVEVSTDGVTWQPATGTQIWSASVTAPAGPTWRLYARATDHLQQVSQVVSQTVVLDTVAPLITVTVPALVGGSSTVELSGEIRDPGPAGAEVNTVGIQFDSPSAPVENAILYKRSDGSQIFIYTWALPAEDGVAHTVRFLVRDYAGNLTTTPFYNVTVDTILPQVALTSSTSAAPAGGVTLAGTVSDGSPISRMTVSYYDPVIGLIVDQVTPVSGSWSYSSGLPVGSYSMIIEATDTAGNLRRLDPVSVTIVDPGSSASLTGTLAFTGRGTAPDARWVEPVTVTMHAVGVITPTYSYSTTTDQSGQFTLSGMAPGTYDVAVKTPSSLRIVQQLTLTAGNNVANFGTVIGGDVNGDNAVTLLDFSILSASFNLAQGSPGYDARADLNNDGQVTALDFSILASNFNTTGQTVGN